jgi:tetratricopeptide (TPR) repeat protein
VPFRDASERLERVHESLVQQLENEERYQQAKSAEANRDLERARRLFLACQKSQPDFLDVAACIARIDRELNKADVIYERAVNTEKRSYLERAKTLYEECLSIAYPFRDANDRRQRIQLTLNALSEERRLEQERQLLEARRNYHRVIQRYPDHGEAVRRSQSIDSTYRQIDRAYESMLEAERKGKFPMALNYAVKIRKQCLAYKDVEKRLPRLESEVDYGRGCELESKKRYRDALRCFERCAERTPQFRDVDVRLRLCQEKTDEPDQQALPDGLEPR